MENSIGIIGGADGPTAVFVTRSTGFGWLNGFGLILVVLLLIPNIVYAIKTPRRENRCTNQIMNLLEQIGRYGCMFLMVFNIGIAELGFSSVGAFLLYLVGNACLMIAYWVVWILYFYKETYWKQIALAVIPTCLFLLSGITMGHILLIVSAAFFGIGHIYVTSKNAFSGQGSEAGEKAT